MINIAFRILLTFNATSLLVIIFLVQKGYTLGHLARCFTWLSEAILLPNVVSYFFYLLIPILCTGFSIWLSKFLGKDEFKKGEIASIERV